MDGSALQGTYILQHFAGKQQFQCDLSAKSRRRTRQCSMWKQMLPCICALALMGVCVQAQTGDTSFPGGTAIENGSDGKMDDGTDPTDDDAPTLNHMASDLAEIGRIVDLETTAEEVETEQVNCDGVNVKYAERAMFIVSRDNDCCCNTRRYYWRVKAFLIGDVWWNTYEIPNRYLYQWHRIGICETPGRPCKPFAAMPFSKSSQCIQRWEWRVFLSYIWDTTVQPAVRRYRWHRIRLPDSCSCVCRAC